MKEEAELRDRKAGSLSFDIGALQMGQIPHAASLPRSVFLGILPLKEFLINHVLLGTAPVAGHLSFSLNP